VRWGKSADKLNNTVSATTKYFHPSSSNRTILLHTGFLPSLWDQDEWKELQGDDFVFVQVMFHNKTSSTFQLSSPFVSCPRYIMFGDLGYSNNQIIPYMYGAAYRGMQKGWCCMGTWCITGKPLMDSMLIFFSKICLS